MDDTLYASEIEFVNLTEEERAVLGHRLLTLEGNVSGDSRGQSAGEADPAVTAMDPEIIVELEADLPRVPPPGWRHR